MTIHIHNLCHFYESSKPIIKNLSLVLEDKKFTSLLGPSGCGKTTLLRMIAGLERPAAGQITIDEQVVVDCEKKIFVKPEKRNISMVFQNYAIWPHMSVFENVAFPLIMKKVPAKDINTQVLNALSMVQLEGLQNRLPHQLSGGQQQRVALARAIVQKPRLLLLDEPLSNLDAALRGSMREELKKLQKALDISAILVTHDWADAQYLSDTICILDQGTLIQQGTRDEISLSPKNDFVKKVIQKH